MMSNIFYILVSIIQFDHSLTWLCQTKPLSEAGVRMKSRVVVHPWAYKSKHVSYFTVLITAILVNQENDIVRHFAVTRSTGWYSGPMYITLHDSCSRSRCSTAGRDLAARTLHEISPSDRCTRSRGPTAAQGLVAWSLLEISPPYRNSRPRCHSATRNFAASFADNDLAARQLLEISRPDGCTRLQSPTTVRHLTARPLSEISLPDGCARPHSPTTARDLTARPLGETSQPDHCSRPRCLIASLGTEYLLVICIQMGCRPRPLGCWNNKECPSIISTPRKTVQNTAHLYWDIN